MMKSWVHLSAPRFEPQVLLIFITITDMDMPAISKAARFARLYLLHHVTFSRLDRPLELRAAVQYIHGEISILAYIFPDAQDI